MNLTPPLVRHTVLAIAFLLAGCAPQILNDPVANRLKPQARIAAVSVMGDKFTRIYIGVVVFQNETSVEDVGGWKVDEAAEAGIIESASQRTERPVVALALSREERLAVRRKPGMTEALVRVAREQGFDTLIVAAGPPDERQYNDTAGSLGFTRRASIRDAQGCLYVRMNVNVYDVATGSKMGWGDRLFEERHCWAVGMPTNWTPGSSDFKHDEETRFRAAAEEHARGNAALGTAAALKTAFPDKFK